MEGRDLINAPAEAQGGRPSLCSGQSAGMCLCTSQAAGLSLAHADGQRLLVGDLRRSFRWCGDSWGTKDALCSTGTHAKK